MSRILPVTQLTAILSLWLTGLSALAVACLSIVATMVVALGTVGVWIWQDQRNATTPDGKEQTGARYIRAPGATGLGIAS